MATRWWRCLYCKKDYCIRFPGDTDPPKPPGRQIEEMGVCEDCVREARIQHLVAQKGYYQPRLFETKGVE